MSVYVDDFRAAVRVGQAIWKMSHMIADTREELDAMAEAIELDAKWKQKAGEKQEHFDVTENYRQRAIGKGAIAITAKELARKLIDRNLTVYLEGRE